MEEQNKTTESGQAAADLDKSLARLETATKADTASRTASPETSTTTATTSKPSNSRTAANETERRTMDGLAAFILLAAVFIAWLGGDHDGPAGPRK